jgi:ABC-type transporter MlaC component
MKNSSERTVNIIIAIFILLSLLISGIALASTEAAETKVKGIFGKIESSLSMLKNKNEFTKNNIMSELNKHLLPEVNTQFFSNKVLSKNLKKVPEDLKADFVTELSIQLINTYSNLLSKHNDETIEVHQATSSKSGKLAMVNVTVVGKNKTNKAVVKLIKSTDETWKFFDIVVEGISLIDTKQAEINASFNKLGAEGTLKRLQEINKKSSS